MAVNNPCIYGCTVADPNALCPGCGDARDTSLHSSQAPRTFDVTIRGVTAPFLLDQDEARQFFEDAMDAVNFTAIEVTPR